MAGCGRRPKMDKESNGKSGEMPAAHQASESSNDNRTAHPKKTSEYSLKKLRVRKQRVFTEAQLNAFEALFKKKQFLSLSEREQLANQLCLPQRSIKFWFQNRRAKVRHQALISQPDPIWGWLLDSETLTQDQRDFLHKQKMDATISVVEAQKQSVLDMFPPPRPMGSYVLPQGLHSSGMVYCKNVGGPPHRCYETEVYKMLPESDHRRSNTYLFNLCLPNKTPKPGTSIWTPVPSVTTDRTSYDGPSTSSGPSTSRMPIAPDNADEGSSTDTSLVIDVEATDSD